MKEISEIPGRSERFLFKREDEADSTTKNGRAGMA